MLRLTLLAVAAFAATRVESFDLSAALGGAGGFSGLLATCDFASPTQDTWIQTSRIANGIKQNAGRTRIWINRQKNVG